MRQSAVPAVAAARLEPRPPPDAPRARRRRASQPAGLGPDRRGDTPVPELGRAGGGNRGRLGPLGRRPVGPGRGPRSPGHGQASGVGRRPVRPGSIGPMAYSPRDGLTAPSSQCGLGTSPSSRSGRLNSSTCGPDSLWAHTLTNSVSPSDGPGTWADAVLLGALPSCRRDGGGRLGGQS